MHRARVVERIAKRSAAQRSGKGGKEVIGCGLVIPHVCATAETAAELVVYAFKSVKFAVGGAKRCGGNQRREIGCRSVLHRAGQGAFADGGGKPARVFFQPLQIGRCIFSRFPRACESIRVVIADDGIFGSRRCAPTAAARRTIRKMPGDEKRVQAFRSRRNRPLYAKRTNGVPIVRFGAQFPIREIVPEQHRRVPPSALLPAPQHGHSRIAAIEQAESEATLQRIVIRQTGIVHDDPFDAAALATNVAARIGGGAPGWPPDGRSSRIVDAPGDRHFGRRVPRIPDPVTQDRDRQTRVFGIVRNER